MKLSPSNQQYRLFISELKNFDPKKKYNVLEVGAGEQLIKPYLGKNFTYKGMDLGKNQDYNFNLDGGKFPIKSEVFDIIICLETMEHVMYPERVLKEIVRVAKKDAFFFLSMPNEYNFLQRFYHLFGIKTFIDAPFRLVEEHLHIHKPRVKDILNLFSKHLKIQKIDYVWESRHSTEYLTYSSFFRAIDKFIDVLAKLWPEMFTRLVAVKAVKRDR